MLSSKGNTSISPALNLIESFAFSAYWRATSIAFSDISIPITLNPSFAKGNEHFPVPQPASSTKESLESDDIWKISNN